MSPFIVVLVILIAEIALSPEKKKRYHNAEAVLVCAVFCLINFFVITACALIDPSVIGLVGWIMVGVQAVAVLGCKALVKAQNKKDTKPVMTKYTVGIRGKLVNTFYQKNDVGPGLVAKFFSQYVGLFAYIATALLFVYFFIQDFYIGLAAGSMLPPQTVTALLSLILEIGIMASGDSLFKELMDRYNTRKNCHTARELAKIRYENDDDYKRIFLDNYVHESGRIIAATKQNYVDKKPETAISFYDFKTKKNSVYQPSKVNIALEEFIRSNGLEVNPLFCAAYNLIEENKNVLIKTPSYVDFEPYLAAMIKQKVAKTEKIIFIVNSIDNQAAVEKNIRRVYNEYFGFDAVPLFVTINQWYKEVCDRAILEKKKENDPFRHVGLSHEESAAAFEIVKNPDVIIASPDEICDPVYTELIRCVIERLGLIVYYDFNDCVQEEPLYAKIVHDILDSEDTVSSLYMTDGFFDFEQSLDNFFSTRTIYQISVPRKAPETSYDMVWKSENSHGLQCREITDDARDFGMHFAILFYSLGFVKNDAMIVADELDAYSETMLNYTDNRMLSRIDHNVGWSNIMGGKNVMCTVSDTYNNIAHTYLSIRGIGTRSEYVNIIARPYLLRKYLAYNLKYFSNEPRVVSTFSSGIIRSARATAIQVVVKAYVIGLGSEQIKALAGQFKIDETLPEREILAEIAKIACAKDISAKVIYDEKNTGKYFFDKDTYGAVMDKSELLKKVYFHIKDEIIERPKRNYPYLLPLQKIVVNGIKYTVLSIDGDHINLTNSNNRDPICATRIIRNCEATIKSSESYGKKYQYGNDSFIDFTHFVCDLKVNPLGRISFKNHYSLLSGKEAFTFEQMDDVKEKQFKNSSVFKIRIGCSQINEGNRYELAHLMALLLNEMLPTFFPKHSEKIMVSCSGWTVDEELESKDVNTRHIVTPFDIDDPEPAKDNEICIYIAEDSPVETGTINVFWQDEEFRYMLKILEDYLYFVEYVDMDERRTMLGGCDDEIIHALRKALLLVINDKPDADLDGERKCINSLRVAKNKFYKLDLARNYNLFCDFCGKPIVNNAGDNNTYHFYSYSGRVSCPHCYSKAVCSEKYNIYDIKKIEIRIRDWLIKKYKAEITGNFYNYLEDAVYVNRFGKKELVIIDDCDIGLRAAGYASAGYEYSGNLACGVNEEGIGCNAMHVPYPDMYDVERTGYRIDKENRRSIFICDGYSKDFYLGCQCHELTHQWQFENLDRNRMNSNIPSGGVDEYGVENDLSSFRYEGHAVWAEIKYLKAIGLRHEASKRKKHYLQVKDAYGFGYRWLSKLMVPGAKDPHSPAEMHTFGFKMRLLRYQLTGNAFGVMSLYFGGRDDALYGEHPDDNPAPEEKTDSTGADTDIDVDVDDVVDIDIDDTSAFVETEIETDDVFDESTDGAFAE